jgi:acetyl-CoA carboxylase biotin carboxylase subunit/3-methylcrotonyl-CoA carboxylase alpha subunit
VFKKVLVANRGEIACRVLRTCERMGLKTVAVFSDADVTAPHVAAADEAIRLGPPPVKDSYLNVAAVVAAIEHTGADAVHPGYGLLSENRAFAEAVAKAGATFIGPPPEALEAFGDKIKAREVARSVGVAPPPGSPGPIEPDDVEKLRSEADRIGLPVLIKTAGGGGGIGMQVVDDESKLERAARTCADRGKSAFGDGRVYIEKYLTHPRHIEVQIFRDSHGNSVAYGERECSVQRRHQKIIEESPSPAAFFQGEEGGARRRKLWEDALRVVEKVGYVGAGTVEFVADADGSLYFLEVNARLQVEHPVTELVTGLDLVELQLRVAAGEAIPAAALEPTLNGHAVEGRVYAEDPSKMFVPQPGHIDELVWPEGLPGVRVDTGVVEGGDVTPFYDPMIAKVVAHGANRAEAIARLDKALAATRLVLMGPKGPRATNLAFLRQVLADEHFASGSYDTSLAEALAKALKKQN